MNTNKTVLGTAMATALGVSALGIATPVVADSISLSWSGAFTMVTSTGASLLNPDRSGAPWYSGRTAVTGTLSYDLDAGTGSGTVSSFSFFGGGPATMTNISLVGIGDGFGNPGSLILGNMGFNWTDTSYGLPFSIVWDATGLFDTLRGGNPLAPMSVGNVTVSQTIAGVGALAASEGTTFGTPANHYTLPLGPSPVVTTTWNTANIGNPTIGSIPSGTLPLTDDGIAGSPFQQATPFNGFNGNFDITSMHVDSVVSTVPLPAAVWLFGSGLAGLLGAARRRHH